MRHAKKNNCKIDLRRGGLSLAAALVVLLPLGADAEVLRMPFDGGDLVGEVRYSRARHEDTLIDIARQYSVGQDEIVMANPAVDRWLPKEGTRVLLPKQFILPNAPRAGVVVNIPEMRLYYYPVKYAARPQPKPKPAPTKAAGAKGKAPVPVKTAAPGVDYSRPISKADEVITYPVSIGRMDWRTPMGATRIIKKERNPVWVPPESIKREHAKDGDILPDVVPAGPHNPLGLFAMRLGTLGYLIHGTDVDKAYGIGMRVTHGCIRMYPEDIERLFPLVDVGTPVYLVNQPVKLGWSGDTLYAEISQPLDEYAMSSRQLLNEAMELIRKKTAERPVTLDHDALKKAVEKPSGLPVAIGKVQPSPIEASPYQTDPGLYSTGQYQPAPTAPGRTAYPVPAVPPEPAPVDEYAPAPGVPAARVPAERPRPESYVDDPYPPDTTGSGEYAPTRPAPSPDAPYVYPVEPYSSEPPSSGDSYSPTQSNSADDYPPDPYPAEPSSGDSDSPTQSNSADLYPAEPSPPQSRYPDPYAPE